MSSRHSPFNLQRGQRRNEHGDIPRFYTNIMLHNNMRFCGHGKSAKTRHSVFHDHWSKLVVLKLGRGCTEIL